MQRRRNAVMLVLVLVGAGTVFVLSRPQAISLLPTTRIRAILLRRTPLGSSLRKVEASVSGCFGVQHKWVSERGEVPLQGYPSTGSGAAFISAHLGFYFFPFRTDVEAFWIFDAGGGLKDIYVRKDVDSL
jgi:hypothetical protein